MFFSRVISTTLSKVHLLFAQSRINVDVSSILVNENNLSLTRILIIIIPYFRHSAEGDYSAFADYFHRILFETLNGQTVNFLRS